MAQFQELTRILTAAGGARSTTDNETVFLYTSNGTLVSKVFADDKWGDQDILASGVRANSPACYLRGISASLIFYIDSASTLHGLRYDNDEEEWLDDDTIPAVQLHDEGRLAACFVSDDETKTYTFYQNPSQELICLDSEWAPSVLPANPLVGTHLYALVIDERVHVFYVGSDDHFMHYLVEESNGVWVDEVLAKCKLDSTLTRFMVNRGETDLEAYAITDRKVIVQVRGGDEGSVEELGTVDEEGTFVPGTSAECCRWILNWWSSLFVSFSIGFRVEPRIGYRVEPRRAVYW